MKKIIYSFAIAFAFLSCNDSTLPKPIGYYRIDLPEKEYNSIDSLPYPFIIELPQYAYPNLKRTKKDSNFFNIDFPRFGARLHMSYAEVDTNLPTLLEDSRTLVFKHSIKAQDISERLFHNNREKVYGILYGISGNAASSTQFFLTDSSNYFLRGALYFNVQTNPDSLEPVIDYIRNDVVHLMENFKWKGESSDLK